MPTRLSTLALSLTLLCVTPAWAAQPLLRAPAEAAPPPGVLLPLQLDRAALQALQPGERLSLELPGAGRVEAVLDAWQTEPDGRRALGRIEGRAELPLVLLLREAGVSGLIVTRGERFEVGFAGAEQWLMVQAPDTPAQDAPRLLSLEQDSPITTAAQPQARESAQADKPAEAAWPVKLDLVALSEVEPGAELVLPVPEQGDYRVRYDTSQSQDGSVTWVGHLADYGENFRVLITSTPQGSVGSILTPSGTLQLVQQGTRQWIVDPQASGWTPVVPDHDDGLAADQPEIGAGGVARGSVSGSSGVVRTAAAEASDNTVVDVLVLYTPGFASRLGAQTQARINQLIALSNQAYADSGVALSLRLVRAEQVSYGDATSNSDALSKLRSGSDPKLAVAASLRSKYGADLVSLIRPFYLNEQGRNCGVGYIGGSGGSNIAGYAAYGYSVVSDGRDVRGSGAYCGDYTFTHELGHNMGLMHDRATVASQGGGQGAYPYAYGYGQSGSFGSIMSYISPVIGLFSTPLRVDCGSGYACGVAAGSASAADNALALSNVKAAVAGFVGEATPVTFQVSGTISSDGQPLEGVTLSGSTSGATCQASGSNGLYTCTVVEGWAGTLNPSLGSYKFAPTGIKVAKASKNLVNQNFKLSTIVVSGSVMETVLGRGQPLVGVSFAASADGASCNSTDTRGNYRCSLPSGWSGSLTPQAEGRSFKPASIDLLAATKSRTVRIAAVTYDVSGSVTQLVSGKNRAVAGVSFSPSATGAQCSTSDSKGRYRCTVVAGWSGSLTPSKDGLSFSPAAINLSDAAAATAQNIAAQ